MKPSDRVLVALSLCAAIVSCCAAAGCKYSVDSYTTTDAMIVTQAAFIAQVSAECDESPANLYAEVEGKLVVAANAGPNNYQVSWLDDFKKARRGDYLINLYDEAGYGQLRKLLRDGESISSVAPVHSAYVRYSGAYKGVWVNSEFLAAIVSFVVLYFAYTFKSKIVS
jgi:translocon-associated protein subunit delta